MRVHGTHHTMAGTLASCACKVHHTMDWTGTPLSWLERDPCCTMILPLDKTLPSNGGFPLPAPSPCSYSHKGILLKYVLTIWPRINNGFLKKHLPIALFVDSTESNFPLHAYVCLVPDELLQKKHYHHTWLILPNNFAQLTDKWMSTNLVFQILP